MKHRNLLVHEASIAFKRLFKYSAHIESHHTFRISNRHVAMTTFTPSKSNALLAGISTSALGNLATLIYLLVTFSSGLSAMRDPDKSEPRKT
jgi:hypothetical protein